MLVANDATAFEVATSSSLTITKNHQLYDVGADILSLQKFLNAHGYQVALSGPGSAGNETSFFGLLTYKALVKFQASQGLPPTGYLGPLTRGIIAKLPSSVPVSNVPPVSSPTSSAIASSTCTAPAGFACVPGTSIVQPNSPGTGYTPGFGGGGSVSSSPAVNPDTTAPSVSLTAPASGATVSGSSVTLTATSSDNVAVAGVQFKIDGANTGSSGATSPYSITWNSTGVADGSHTIAAVAHDAAGNYATSSISVTVDNTPPVISSISSGTPGQTSATIMWTTNENASSTVSYGLTAGYGSASSSPVLATSHSVTLTGLTAATTYHFQIQSADGQGNLATSSDQTFTTLLPLNSRAVFLGDSITAGSVDDSFANWAVLYAGGRFYEPPGANQGVGGNSTDQMLARVTSSTALLSGYPGVLVVLGGTNDITGTLDTATQTESNLRAIYNAAEAAGARVIGITITDRSDSSWNSSLTSHEAYRNAVNTRIKSQPDISVVDMDAVGFATSTMTVDGLHPNRSGAMLIGQQVGAAMASLVDPSSILYAGARDEFHFASIVQYLKTLALRALKPPNASVSFA